MDNLDQENELTGFFPNEDLASDFFAFIRHLQSLVGMLGQEAG
jgi:hypothetical protein